MADADPRVVDQYVQPPHDGNGFLDGGPDLVQIRDVARHERSQPGHFGREPLTGFLIQIQDHHLGALFQEPGRRRQSDSAGASRDDHALSLESPHGSVLGFWSDGSLLYQSSFKWPRPGRCCSR